MAKQTFVARERELERLHTFLVNALAGQGQVSFVTGEAGAGKTALVTQFARRAQEVHSDLLVAIGNCNAQTGIGDPYLPFRQVLGQLTGDVEAKLAQGAITQENANRLRAFLVRSGQVLIEVAPDLVDVLVPGSRIIALVGTTIAEKLGWVDELGRLIKRKQDRPARAEPILEQRRLFEQYTNVLTALAAEQPLMVVLDDLQWADRASIGLLFHLCRSVRQSRILIVGAYRPDEVDLGRGDDRHPLEAVVNELKRYFGDISIDLDRMVPAEGRHFVNAFLDSQPNRLGEDFRQALFQRTEGHPLFTSELLRDMQEHGDLVQDTAGRWVVTPSLDWESLPARVEGVIEERIDRLEEELREILSVASVEGEAFTAQVVSRVQKMEERQLLRALSQELERRHRLVWEQGEIEVNAQLLSRYRFVHALFQQYLYSDLGAGERRLLHGEVAAVLEALYEEETEDIAVQLARHFWEARIRDKAIYYLQQAGHRAAQLSAHDEAIVHYSSGLDLLGGLPDDAKRAQQELELQMSLGNALLVTKGFGTSEVEKAFARARELCHQEGETPQLLQGLWLFYLVRAKLQTAQGLAEQALARRADDPGLLVVAYPALGATLLFLGEFVPALVHLEQGIAVYDPRQHSSLTVRYGGVDAGVSGLAYASFALWVLGYPDQAMTKIHAALTLARELSHPFSLALALEFAVVLHYLRREAQDVQEYAEEAIALSTDRRFPYWMSMGVILQGRLRVEQGRIEEGIAQIRKGLSDYRAMGGELSVPFFLGILAEAHGKAGQPEKGLAVLAEALSMAQQNGELAYEAAHYRLRGELLLMQGESTTEAKTCFQQAVDVARRQAAKSLELRATISLCRLMQQQDRGEEGRQMLAEVYGWFSEGFDTPDLVETRELLGELDE